MTYPNFRYSELPEVRKMTELFIKEGWQLDD